MFKMVAAIQTADMLNLPVPEAEYHNVVTSSAHQRNMVAELAERAEKVRNGMYATEDNMLKITNDGRKLALDQRLISDLLPDDEDGKGRACVNNIYSPVGTEQGQAADTAGIQRSFYAALRRQF